MSLKRRLERLARRSRERRPAVEVWTEYLAELAGWRWQTFLNDDAPVGPEPEPPAGPCPLTAYLSDGGVQARLARLDALLEGDDAGPEHA